MINDYFATIYDYSGKHPSVNHQSLTTKHYQNGQQENTLQVVVGSILILLLIGVTVLLISEKRANNELVQEFNLEKEDLENQYTDFAKQYDELKLTVSNDSLSVLLEQEQLKTQRLLEELRTVKVPMPPKYAD